MSNENEWTIRLRHGGELGEDAHKIRRYEKRDQAGRSTTISLSLESDSLGGSASHVSKSCCAQEIETRQDARSSASLHLGRAALPRACMITGLACEDSLETEVASE